MGTVQPISAAATTPAEAELIAACQRGDREALQKVFMTHAPYLERLLTRIAGPVLAPDLLQNTFVAAIDAFPRFRGEAQVRTWLTRIAIRTTQQTLRRAEYKRRAPGDPAVDLRLAAEGCDPEQTTARRQQLESLQRHLGQLDPDKRLPFVLHVVDGHPLEDVAGLLGISTSAAKSRVFWARKILFKRIRKDPALCGWLEARESTP